MNQPHFFSSLFFAFWAILLILNLCNSGFTSHEDFYSQEQEQNGSLRFLTTEEAFLNEISLGQGSIVGQRVIELNNGGYVATGYTHINAEKKIFIIKADSAGQVSNAIYLNRTEDTQATAIAQTSSNDLIVVGYTTVGTNQQILVMKLSQSLTINWIRTYEDSGITTQALDVALLSSGGTQEILITCIQRGNPNERVGMIKLDLNGGILFKKLFTNLRPTNGMFARESTINSDQFFLMGSKIQNGSTQAYFGKFTNTGSQEYGYYYGIGGVDKTDDLYELQNGDLILAGDRVEGSVASVEVLKYSPQSSSSQWHKQLPFTIHSRVRAIEVINDLEILIGGHYEFQGQTKDFTSLLNSQGNQQWMYRFYQSEYDSVKDIAVSNTNVTLLLTVNEDTALISIPKEGNIGNLTLPISEIAWTDGPGLAFQTTAVIDIEWSALTTTSLSHQFLDLEFIPDHTLASSLSDNGTTPPGPPTTTDGGGNPSEDNQDIWLAVGLSIASVILLVIVILVCVKFKKSVTKSKQISTQQQRLKSRSETPMVTEKDHLALTTDQIVIDVTAPRNSQHLIIPPRFICPISHEIMSDPVTNKHKEAFERVCLEFRLQQEKYRTPPLLITNNKLKRDIETWLLEQPVEFIRKRKALREKIHNWISKRGRQNLERDPVLRDIVVKFDAALEPK